MDYQIISADCHIDLPWLPPELFTSEAREHLKERMPYVAETEKGPYWVSRGGGQFGLQNGMGSAGRVYVPGQIHRSDRMAEQGLYSDGEKGIRRLTEPDLRLRDQDLDGVQAEVLYGILGAAMRLGDDEAADEMMRIYNEWLAGFCAAHPDRYAGLATIPSHDVDAAVTEVTRVAKRGVLRGIEVANTHEMAPLFDPSWEPLWAVAEEAGLPVHYHTIGPRMDYDYSKMAPLQRRQAFAVHITSFQLAMSKIIMETIYGGVLEAHPGMKLVIGESGIGWIPYILEHMDLEWEDQFADLTLTMKPSEYWKRQCYATYQSDPIGIRLLDILGGGKRDVGERLPAPGWGVAGFQGVHRPRAGRRAGRRAAQDHLRKRRPAIRLHRVGNLYTSRIPLEGGRLALPTTPIVADAQGTRTGSPKKAPIGRVGKAECLPSGARASGGGRGLASVEGMPPCGFWEGRTPSLQKTTMFHGVMRRLGRNLFAGPGRGGGRISAATSYAADSPSGAGPGQRKRLCRYL